MDLPTPGLAREEHDAAGHQAAAEHAVELVDSGGSGLRGLDGDVVDALRGCGHGPGDDAGPGA